MTAATATAPLARLAPIALDELVERASLQTRIDRKYVVRATALENLLAGLDPDTRVLEIGGLRDFRYESVYFDTPALTSYWMAARARRKRFKVRTRSYVDSDSTFLEVKTRGARSATVKDRLEYSPDERGEVSPEGYDYAWSTLEEAGFDELEPTILVPTLITRYERMTLFVAGSASRATIDTGLRWVIDEQHPLERPDIAIVETKSGSRASDVDRLLWAHGHRPATISKYGTGLAALRNDLPSNKWSRILRRHFDVAPLSYTPTSVKDAS
ncbi:polyphosphate polymerase domain-containing protein [Agreia sp.]|uniref:polyphosphate polymerase domain-containing protein n=1 Tax=Agreia sp. TaxID=1872416 RepID=UPI0035BC61E4